MEDSHHDIVSELYFLQEALPRLTYLAFEADDFSVTSPAGQQLMRGLFEVLPDTKLCEDGHQSIKADLLRKTRGETRNSTARMGCLVKSPVFVSRNIPAVQMSEEEVAQFQASKQSKAGEFRNKTISSKCKTSVEVQRIMRPDMKYAAPTPQSCFQGAAATEWVIFFAREKLASKGAQIQTQ